MKPTFALRATALVVGHVWLSAAMTPLGAADWQERYVLKTNTRGFQAVEFAPDGSAFATAAPDGLIRVIDAGTGKEKLKWQAHRGATLAVAYTPDGKALLSVGYDGVVKTWDSATGKDKGGYRLGLTDLATAAFSPDAKTLAVSVGNVNPAQAQVANQVLVFDAAAGKKKVFLKGHDFGASKVAFAPDGKTLVSLGSGTRKDVKPGETFADLMAAEAKVWDLETGKETATTLGCGMPAALSADGKALASTAYDEKTKEAMVKVIDPATGKATATVTGFKAYVAGLAFSPDGKTLVAADAEGQVKVIDAASGKEATTLKGGKGYSLLPKFSPDGGLLVVGQDDGTLRVWASSPGKP